MKRKSAKILGLLLSSVLAVTLFTACDFEEPCRHEEKRIESDESSHWYICRDCDEPLGDAVEHEWRLYGEYDGFYNCDYDEEYSFYCSGCERHKRETVAALGHELVDGECTRCHRGVIYALNSDKTAYTVVSYGSLPGDKEDTGGAVELVIPAVHNGLPVTAIAASAFSGTSGLHSLTLPDSITHIDEGAFAGCGIGTVVLPSTLTYIPKSAFVGADIDEIVMPEGLVEIGDEAFADCDIERLDIPEGVTRIGTRVFYRASITEITVPDSVSEIGDGAFSYCEGLRSVRIGKGVREITTNAFYYSLAIDRIYFAAEGISDMKWFTRCTMGSDAISFIIGKDVEVAPVLYDEDDYLQRSKLKSLVFEEGSKCRTIPDLAFKGCWGVQIIELPSELESIGDGAFWGTAVFSLDLPDTVRHIGESAFFMCNRLPEITIPAGVSAIGAHTFSECYSLTSVRLLGEIKTVGESAFYGCEALEGVYVSDLAAWCGIDFAAQDSNPLLYADLLYIGDTPLTSDVIIPEGVTKIGDFAFFCFSGISTLSLPSGIEKIGKCAFAYCEGLASVSLSEGLAEIADEAFIGCYGLETVNLPSTLKRIGERSFEYCELLRDVTLPLGIESIGWQAFLGCQSFTEIEVPGGIIGDGAFQSCDGVKTVTIGSAVTAIGARAFPYLDALEHIYYNAVSCPMEFGMPFDRPFYVEHGGVTLHIGEGVELFPTQLTSGVYGISFDLNFSDYCEMDFERPLTERFDTVLFFGEALGADIEIPEGTERIGSYAFAGLPIRSVTIPDSVTALGAYAFSGCRELTDVIGGRNVSHCGEGAVNYDLVEETLHGGIYYKFNTLSRLADTSLRAVAVREGTAKIPARFFEGCESLVHVYVPHGCEIGDRAFINTNIAIRVLLEDEDYAGGDWRILIENESGRFLIGGTALVGGVSTQLGSIERGILYDAESSLAYRYSDTLAVPGGVVYGYFGTERELSIPDTLGGISILQIAPSAFITLGIERVTLPNSVTEVESNSFAYCSALTSVDMPAVTELGSYAFLSCTSLTDVTMGSVIYIRPYAFCGCTALSTVNLPSSIRYINGYAFYGCSSLTSVSFASVGHTWLLFGTDGVALGVTDPRANAENLTLTYSRYDWIIDSEIE